MLKNNCSLIGYISKPHGKSGDVNIRLSSYDAERIEPGEPIFVEINGALVPFFITEITPKGNLATIHLQFVDSLDESKKLSGKNIYQLSSALPEEPIDNTFEPSMLAGFHFKDLKSSIEGKIEEYIDNPSNPLFLINTAEKKFLIPAHPDIIVSIDIKTKTVSAELPEGLYDV